MIESDAAEGVHEEAEMPSEIRPIDIADIGQLEAALEEVAAGAPPQLLVEAFVRHS